MYFLEVFGFACVLSLAHSAVFVSDLANRMRSTRERLALYQKLLPHMTKVGRYELTPFQFDRDCLAVYRTNDWLFSQCDLPKNCTSPKVVKLERTFFGSEIVICHSQKTHSEVGEFDFFNFNFVKKPLSLREPIFIDDKEFTVLNNLTPVSFFEWFYLVRSDNGLYGLVPKICGESLRNSSALPKNVRIEHKENDELCIVEVSHDSYSCVPTLYPSIGVLMQIYDFPVEFDGAPFSQGAYSLTNNRAMGADQYLANNRDKQPFVVDKVGGSYMVTFEPPGSSSNFYIVKNTGYLPYERPNCVKLTSHYSSPFDNLIRKISKFFRDELGFLIDFLKEIAADLALILFRVVGELFEILTSFIPWNNHFYTGVFLSVVTYIFVRDYLISIGVFIVAYFLKIYMNSLI